jgi:acyl-CoA thioesterase-1
MRFRFSGPAARPAARPLLGILVAVWGFLMAGTMAEARTIRLVALGDSLTAGYQLAGKDAFPSVLEAALKAKGHDVVI